MAILLSRLLALFDLAILLNSHNPQRLDAMHPGEASKEKLLSRSLAFFIFRSKVSDKEAWGEVGKERFPFRHRTNSRGGGHLKSKRLFLFVSLPV